LQLGEYIVYFNFLLKLIHINNIITRSYTLRLIPFKAFFRSFVYENQNPYTWATINALGSVEYRFLDQYPDFFCNFRITTTTESVEQIFNLQLTRRQFFRFMEVITGIPLYRNRFTEE